MEHSYQIFGMNLLEFVLLILALIIVFSFFGAIARKILRNSPLDILHQKFSKGKISEQEYEKEKRFLEKEQDLKMRMFFYSSFSKD
jgi:uncharacterized membrane protein